MTIWFILCLWTWQPNRFWPIDTLQKKPKCSWRSVMNSELLCWHAGSLFGSPSCRIPTPQATFSNFSPFLPPCDLVFAHLYTPPASFLHPPPKPSSVQGHKSAWSIPLLLTCCWQKWPPLSKTVLSGSGTIKSIILIISIRGFWPLFICNACSSFRKCLYVVSRFVFTLVTFEGKSMHLFSSSKIWKNIPMF